MRIVKGQVISEYGLVLALIAVVMLGALTMLGIQIAEGHMNNANEVASAKELYGLLDGNGAGLAGGGGGQGGTPQVTAPVGAPTAQTSLPTTAASTTPVIPGTAVEITTGSGLVINVDYPTDLQNSIETAGANGTTELLLGSLEHVIEQLEMAGDIDAAQASSLKALANQGHRIASVEHAVADAMANKTIDQLQNETISWDGQNWSTLGLISEIGCDNSCIEAPLTDATKFRPETQRFVDLYDQAVNSGAMADPVVHRVVEQLASEIVQLSDTMESVYAKDVNTASSTTAVGSFNTMMAGHLASKSDQNSAGICHAGGGTDTGVSCP